MCSLILRVGPAGVHIAANRDEMLARLWTPPAAYWPDLPGVIAGRDSLAGGTWLGLNRHGVVAAVLNRRGTLGPAAGKRSRGELPLLALAHPNAAAAARAIAALDAAQYRSFNVVIASATEAWFLRGLGQGEPDLRPLSPGTWMITAGEPNEPGNPRIARHLPHFEAAAFAQWPTLLADAAPPAKSALNVPPQNGFGTVCAAVIALPPGGPPIWRFAAGPPDSFAFQTIDLAPAAQPV